MELGATWLHGLAGNPLYDYAVEQGLMSATADQKGQAAEVADVPFDGFMVMSSNSCRLRVAAACEASTGRVRDRVQGRLIIGADLPRRVLLEWR